MATRRIVLLAEFRSSLTALECPGAERMVEELAGHLAARPECTPSMDGSVFHVLHTRSYGDYPPLQVYYRFDDEEVCLLDVELYDPLVFHVPERGH